MKEVDSYSLDKFVEENSGKNLVVLCVSGDVPSLDDAIENILIDCEKNPRKITKTKYAKINISENTDFSHAFGIYASPTILLFDKSGDFRSSLTGKYPEEIIKKFKLDRR